MRRDVFQAIADPTRREIINLVTETPLTLNKVTEKFNISRPAISKHIKILSECGLIEIKQKGRERFCFARVEGLEEIADWIGQFSHLWEARLDSFESYLETIQKKGNDDGK